MKTISKSNTGQLIITNEDYETINSYVKGLMVVKNFEKNNTALLEQELKKATLVKKEQLPADVVRLNSRVVIQEENNNKLIELVLVVPEKANIKERKISVFTSIGTALIGFRQGARVIWEVPSGNKTFTIKKVNNTQE